MEQHCVECGKIRFMQGGREVQIQAPLASSEAFSFCLANSASLQHCCRTLAAFSSHLQRLQCMLAWGKFGPSMFGLAFL